MNSTSKKMPELQLVTIPSKSSKATNDARLRELETKLQLSGASGGCSRFPMLIRYVCPNYGQN